MAPGVASSQLKDRCSVEHDDRGPRRLHAHARESLQPAWLRAFPRSAWNSWLPNNVPQMIADTPGGLDALRWRWPPRSRPSSLRTLSARSVADVDGAESIRAGARGRPSATSATSGARARTAEGDVLCTAYIYGSSCRPRCSRSSRAATRGCSSAMAAARGPRSRRGRRSVRPTCRRRARSRGTCPGRGATSTLNRELNDRDGRRDRSPAEGSSASTAGDGVTASFSRGPTWARRRLAARAAIAGRTQAGGGHARDRRAQHGRRPQLSWPSTSACTGDRLSTWARSRPAGGSRSRHSADEVNEAAASRDRERDGATAGKPTGPGSSDSKRAGFGGLGESPPRNPTYARWPEPLDGVSAKAVRDAGYASAVTAARWP